MHDDCLVIVNIKAYVIIFLNGCPVIWNRPQLTRGAWRNGGSEKLNPVKDRTRSAPPNLSLDHLDIPSQSARSSFSRDSISDIDSEISGSFSAYGSLDFTSHNLDFSSTPTSPVETRQSAVSVRRLWRLISPTKENCSFLFTTNGFVAARP